MRVLHFIFLLWSTTAFAEEYQSCLTHESDAYLEVFRAELDKQGIQHIDMVADGRSAVCVLPSDEEAVMQIAKNLAGNRT